MKNIIVLTTVLIVFGIVGYVLFLPKTNILQKSSGNNNTSTLSNLINQTKNQKCTWEKAQEGVKMTGTVYVSGNKFAMDTQTSTKDTAFKAYLVGDGKTIYTWTDSATQGAKLSYNTLESGTDKKGLIYQNLDYVCETWKEESQRFNLPSNITFN